MSAPEPPGASAAPHGDADEQGRAVRLERALAAIGAALHVEPRGRLALLSADAPPASLADAAFRARLAELAAAHGFSHVALALPPAAGDAPGRSPAR